jgi:hypothetical protein
MALSKNQTILIAVVAIAVIAVAGIAIAMNSNNNPNPEPKETGLTGTYDYNVAGSNIDPTEKFNLKGTTTVYLNNGSSSPRSNNITESGAGSHPKWAFDAISVPVYHIGDADKSGIGQKNAMLSGAVFKENTTIEYHENVINVGVYTATLTGGLTQAIYADANGVVYKVVTSDGTYTLTYTLTSHT